MAATGFTLVAAFQVFLALGISLGQAVWGGVYETLPPGLGIASAISAVVLVVAATVVLGRAGYRGRGIRRLPLGHPGARRCYGPQRVRELRFFEQSGEVHDGTGRAPALAVLCLDVAFSWDTGR